jgi:hypothetical protein
MPACLARQGLRRVGAALCFSIGVTGLVASACDGNPASPSGPSNLTILLTDDITDDVEQVNIFFTGVTAKPSDGPVEEIALRLTENPIDLLTLADDVTTLAAGVVEPGRYEFIHINIDERRSHVVENGIRKALQIPSEEVKILGGFIVDEDHRTTLTLDFDARTSLIRRGNGEWLLRPVIVITGNDMSSQ